MSTAPQLPKRSGLARNFIAASLAAAGITAAHIMLADRTEQLPPKIHHDIPDEVLCKVPHARTDDFPTAISSDKPIIRLCELSPGNYRLLYWGNPVRKSYTYTIRRLSNNESVLCSRNGERIEKATLPVLIPAREDKKLPRQPIVEIGTVRGEPGVMYAVKITVHDGTNGIPLCSEVYLIEGTPPAPSARD